MGIFRVQIVFFLNFIILTLNNEKKSIYIGLSGRVGALIIAINGHFF